MTRHYEELACYERNGFDIIVDKSYEDLDPKDCFDDECFNLKEMYSDIESGNLDWFMLRVRVMVENIELSSEFLGGCLYKDAREVLTDGTAEDLIAEALVEAKRDVYRLYKKFQDISWELDAEGCTA
jgi:hypothetical protein